MFILTHVLIALSSMLFSSYAFFAPSQQKMRVSYALVGATIATGTYLVVAEPAHMIQACTTGLMYLGAITVVTVATRFKLAKNPTI